MRKKNVGNHRCRNRPLAVVLMFILLGIATASAQDDKIKKQYQPPPKPTSNETAPPSTVVVSPDEDYLIGASDIIEVKIEDAPELSGTFRLNSKGMFVLPGFGEISAKKKTTEEVAKGIGDKLRGGYLMKPIVSVTVKQSNSRAFFIQGAVRRPGIYQIEGHPSLIKLITVAGGLADNYGTTAYIIREKKKDGSEPASEGNESGVIKTEENPADANTPKQIKTSAVAETDKETDGTIDGEEKYELIKANINNLLKGNFEQNVVIESGDIVHIPQGDIFFVAGEVKAPGSFQLKEGTTLRQAISLAQGTNFESDLGKSVIYRDNPQTGKRDEIKIDVGAIMSGKKEDLEIFPNDIVIVPNSKTKTVTKSLLKIISGGLPRLLGFY